MSRFSGKADLFDQIYEIGARVGDTELELFEKFKKETDGVIYQNTSIKINEFNIDFLIEQEKKKYGDKYYLYPEIMLRKAEDGHGYYWVNNKYFKNLKALTEYSEFYYLRKEIHFDKIIDLVKYYPYLCAAIASEVNSEGNRSTFIELSEKAYTEMRREQCYMMGTDPSYLDYYDEELKKEFIRVAKQYD